MTKKIIPILVGFCLLGMVALTTSADAQSQVSMPLTDLSQWQSPTANWQIVGGVSSNRNVVQDLVTTSGTGVLANKMTADKKGHLTSTFSHGDLDLELEVMMPKGSNSGIYLMGRYEVQLFDSWGNNSPAFSDIGGIYQRWNSKAEKRQEGYEGKAPRVNACRAPGLWQTLRISFRGPRFDAFGRKVSNAKFLKVMLNDYPIHENVECTGPTRGAVSDQEVASAPLMIQGDHGPVALRNIKYSVYDKTPLKLADMNYQTWYGKFRSLSDFMTKKPDEAKPTDELTWRLSKFYDDYAIRITGNLVVSEPGTYNFTFQADGYCKLVIGGNTLFDTSGYQRWYKRRDVGTTLASGKVPFEIIIFKSNVKNKAGLGLGYTGPNLRFTYLNEESSLNEEKPADGYFKEAGTAPELMRCFVKHRGHTLPYAAAISNPHGPHYELNLMNNSLIRAWRGNFADVAGMWESRGGNQQLWYRGSSIDFADDPIVAPLANSNAAWPDTLTERYKFNGYSYGRADGTPVVSYGIEGATILDRWEPSENNQVLTHKIKAENVPTGLWVRLAAGTSIDQLADGSYLIDKGRFYIVPLDGLKPIIRTVGGQKELVYNIPASASNAGKSSNISYQLVW